MVTLGRSPNNDVWVALASVSKFHASFTKGVTGWTVSDQRATNETFIEEKPLGKGASAVLADWSTIDFGPEARAIFFTPEGLHAALLKWRETKRLPGT
jgi:hypothetical protein